MKNDIHIFIFLIQNYSQNQEKKQTTMVNKKQHKENDSNPTFLNITKSLSFFRFR